MSWTTACDERFTDAFIAHLLAIGTDRDLIDAQRRYNDEPSRELDVEGPVLAIDAVAVEHWLADHAGPMLGLDVRVPTVFLVNWHGRPDFRFHVYTHTSQPDADTGVVRGLEDRFALMAWGGTAADDPVDGTGRVARVWIHDLSAGPVDARTFGFDLTNRDVTGHSEGWAEFYGLDPEEYVDYRLPPVWEYGSDDDYRPFDDLSGDLARIVRYVATDLLFVPSPLYKPSLSPPLMPDHINIDINRVTPAGTPHAPVTPDLLLDAVGRLRPWSTFTTAFHDVPFEGRLAQVNACWSSAFEPPFQGGRSCYGRRGGGTAWYDMFFYIDDHRAQLTSGVADYDVPVLLFEMPPDVRPPIAGHAGPDPLDLEFTQSHVQVYDSEEIREQFGTGPTHTLIHEVGHHLGLSHPHDGLHHDFLDTFERDDAFSPLHPFERFHFIWVGDQSATVMSYLPPKPGFSQFEQDVMARWLSVGYVNQANHLLARIFDHPRARDVDHLVIEADATALEGLFAWVDSDFARAAVLGHRAYAILLDAAAALQIPVEPQARPADDRARTAEAFFGDPSQPFFVREGPPGRRNHHRPVDLSAFEAALVPLPAGGLIGPPPG